MLDLFVLADMDTEENDTANKDVEDNLEGNPEFFRCLWGLIPKRPVAADIIRQSLKKPE